MTRQVVTPVRLARRIAERLAAGRLEERMHVRGEDDLARLGQSFNQMAASLQKQIRQLEELSRLQRRFVSDVSHELRTPITTVRLAADVLHDARGTFDPPTGAIGRAPADRARPVRGAARRPAGDQPLRCRRRTAGDRPGRPGRHRLPGRRLLQQPGRPAGCQPSRSSAPGVPAVVEADVRRIERIARNLVVNAIHYSGAERVEILIAARLRQCRARGPRLRRRAATR
ncbi:MAG: HAMP domain-containing protein [Nocardioidaceae bacterium]